MMDLNNDFSGNEGEKFEDPHQIIGYVDYQHSQDEVKYEYRGRLYTWDDEKALNCSEKHHVTFKLAAQVFHDPYYLSYWDSSAPNEERINIIGRIQSQKRTKLFVVYAQRSFDKDKRPIFRIISARKARPKEVEKYNENLRRAAGGRGLGVPSISGDDAG